MKEIAQLLFQLVQTLAAAGGADNGNARGGKLARHRRAETGGSTGNQYSHDFFPFREIKV